MTVSIENRGDYMNEGGVLICIDTKDEHYLQVGCVNLIDIEGYKYYLSFNNLRTSKRRNNNLCKKITRKRSEKCISFYGRKRSNINRLK